MPKPKKEETSIKKVEFEITQIPINKLNPDENNPREISDEMLKNLLNPIQTWRLN